MQQNADPVATLKLYKSKSRWIVSKQVMGMTLATVALGFGLLAGSPNEINADVATDESITGQTAGYHVLKENNNSEVKDSESVSSHSGSQTSSGSNQNVEPESGSNAQVTGSNEGTTSAETGNTSAETQSTRATTTYPKDSVDPDVTTGVQQNDFNPVNRIPVAAAKKQVKSESIDISTKQSGSVTNEKSLPVKDTDVSDIEVVDPSITSLVAFQTQFRVNTQYDIYTATLDSQGQLVMQEDVISKKAKNLSEISLPQKLGYKTAHWENAEINGELAFRMNYVPKTIQSTVEITVNIGNHRSKIMSDIVQGLTDEDIQVKVPDIAGYRSDQNTVTAHVNRNGSITTNTTVYLSPTIQDVRVIPVDSSGKLIVTNNNLPIVSGYTGTIVDAPNVEGYLPESIIIPSMDSSMKVQYAPAFHEYIVQPVDENGNQIFGAVSYSASGFTGESIHLSDLQFLPGYSAQLSTSNIVPKGRSNVNVLYTSKPMVKQISVYLVDQNGQPMKGISMMTVSGKAGQPFEPISFEGYLSPKLVKINKDGNKQTVVYSAKMLKNSALIPSNLGFEPSARVSARVGEDVLIPVPQLNGYIANKSTVTGHVGSDGSISVNDAVFYALISRASCSNTDLLTNSNTTPTTPTSGTTRSAENGTLPVAPTDAGNVVTGTDATAPTSNKQQEPLAAASNGDSDLNAQMSGKVSGGASNPSTTTTTNSADAPGLAASSEGNVDSLAPTSDDSASASDVVTVSEAGESSATNTKEVSSSSETPQNATNVDAQTLPQTDEEQPSSIPGWGILGLLASCLGFGVAKRKREG